MNNYLKSPSMRWKEKQNNNNNKPLNPPTGNHRRR